MDLITILLIFWAVFRSISNNKKKKTAKQQPKASIFDTDKAEQQRRAQNAGKANAPQRRPAPAKPAPKQMSMLPPRLETAKPQVHTHLAPDCDEHDRTGSLAYISKEGKDACHEDMLAPADAARPGVCTPEEQGGLQLDWSGENMVRAFVMQEVLTRPCDRRRRA